MKVQAELDRKSYMVQAVKDQRDNANNRIAQLTTELNMCRDRKDHYKLTLAQADSIIADQHESLQKAAARITALVSQVEALEKAMLAVNAAPKAVIPSPAATPAIKAVSKKVAKKSK
jgi:uncharacterized coiled-coil DUF342 family protein